MADTTRNYRIRLAAEGGKLVSGEIVTMSRDSERAMNKLGDTAVVTSSKMSMLAQTMLYRLVPAITSGAIIAGIGKIVSSMGDLQDISEKIGVSAEKLQVFRLIGEDVGISAEQSDAALTTFIKRLGEAQQGTGKLVDVLKHYRIELKNADGTNRAWSEVMEDLADRIAKTTDAQEQFFITTRAFGDDGAGFVSKLREGSGWLKEYEVSAKNAGKIIDDELIRKADQFDEAWNRAITSVTMNLKRMMLDILFAEQSAQERIQDAGRFGIDLKTGQIATQAAIIGAEKEQYGPPVPDNVKNKQPDIPPMSGMNLTEEKEAAKIAERQAEKIQDVIKALTFKNEQLARSTEEQELYNQLNAAGVDIDSKSGRIIQDLVTQYQRMSKEIERNTKLADGFGQAVGSAFENAMIEGKGLSDVVQSLGRDIERAIFRTMVTEPITNSVSSFVKDIAPSIFGNLFGGKREHGGDVIGGKAYLVGEKGPEIFAPGRNGSIIPNHALGGGGGGQANVTVPVQIINNTPAQVTTRESSDANGKSIQIMINDAVARGINDPSSSVSKAFDQRNKRTIRKRS